MNKYDSNENETIAMNVDSLVSIIVPVYGTEAYLPECIESITAQTYSDIELILVDDQSPDGCPQICDAYAQKDDRITVIHQKNTGVSGARNTGIRHSRGAYLMFVDSDDGLFPNAVETMLADMWEHGADIVSAAELQTGRNGDTVNNGDDGSCSVFREEEPLLLSLAGQRNTNSVHSKLLRRDFIDGLFFTEGKNIHEDGFFLFQCYLRKPVLVQHNVLVYRYNFRQESSSRDGFSDKYLAMLYFCEQKKKLVAELYPQYTDAVRNMEVRTNLQLLDLLCRTTDPKYRDLQGQCVKTVRRLYLCFRPINRHHKQLARIVKLGLYPLYKFAVRLRYFH